VANQPKTLEDALAAIARLEKVVQRQAARLDELIDGDIVTLKRQARETEITTDWTLGRTDELGEQKPSRKELQGQIRLLAPQTVERVMDRGKVRVRVKRD
jgi:hypothetical protein